MAPVRADQEDARDHAARGKGRTGHRWIPRNRRGHRRPARAAVLNFDDGGRIVSIGTTGAAQAPFPGLGDYVATKAALAAYTRAWSRDLGPRRITVNIVQPGAVNTDMNPADGPNGDFQKSLNSLNRFADPSEVAALVAFLTGPEAGFITGTTVNIDGGLSA